MRIVNSAILLVFILVLCANAAEAHPLAPASLTVTETVEGARYTLTVRSGSALASELYIELPKECEIGERKRTLEADAVVRDDWNVRCRSSLLGETLFLRGLETHGSFALAFARFQSGAKVRAVLSPDAPAFVMPRAESNVHVFAAYLKLGVEHLLTGADHLAFVLGLCLLVNRYARLALTLTAFTIGHSVTLALAALELVRLPSAPVELVIALSIVVLALDLLAFEASPRSRAPYALALGFGLVHGLGFAGALEETGLAGRAVALSLLAFNLGVEAGQILVLLAVSPGLWWLSGAGSRFTPIVRKVFGYGVGSLSAMWCIERALAMF